LSSSKLLVGRAAFSQVPFTVHFLIKSFPKYLSFANQTAKVEILDKIFSRMYLLATMYGDIKDGI